MERQVKIGNQEVTMRVNGNTPRLYREVFGQDLLTTIQKVLSKENDDAGAMEVTENLAYIMSKQADSSIGTIEEWLDQFEMLDIYNASAEIIALWANNQKTTSQAKKK